jgi:hypothetical protein
MVKMAKSIKGSFQGYNLNTALYRNKDAIKYIATIITGYSAYSTMTGFGWKSFLIAIGAGVGTLAGKLLMDAFDFYFTEVEI